MNHVRLIYISRKRPDLVASDMEAILALARRRNTLHELTGLLIASDSGFIQVLEGKEYDVNTIYEAIRFDERHSDVTLVHTEAMADRIFPEWAMGFAGDLPPPKNQMKAWFHLNAQNCTQLVPDGASARVRQLITGFCAGLPLKDMLDSTN
jgi:hypothetical protein